MFKLIFSICIAFTAQAISAQDKAIEALNELNSVSQSIGIDGMPDKFSGVHEFHYFPEQRRFFITKEMPQGTQGVVQRLTYDIDILTLDASQIRLERGRHGWLIKMGFTPGASYYWTISDIKKTEEKETLLRSDSDWNNRTALGTWTNSADVSLELLGVALREFVSEALLTAPPGKGVWKPLMVEEVVEEFYELVTLEPTLGYSRRNNLEELVSVYDQEDYVVDVEDEDVQEETEVFSVVEEMPEFPGGNDNMIAFIQENMIYPQSAMDEDISGTVYVRIEVQRDGSVGSPKVVRGISDECDIEALRLVRSMPKWTQPRHGGKPVIVSYHLPVRFELPEEQPVDEPKEEIFDSPEANNPAIELDTIARKQIIDEDVYVIVEDMPVFKGGEAEMYRFIGSNQRYPEAAKNADVSGTVYVGFVVNKVGEVVNAKVLRGIHPECDAEALRLVNSMPNWKPGKQRGVPVFVQYNLPVRFTLR